ncbi:MAG: glycine cleavage system aminomethyltransferase GcvT [Deltaproteobacteria bacterium]|nr:glycine cleavage system aminomethyltransferase GcvT [Deltaproteobacteria bacterium]
MSELKRTPLYEAHVAAGAKIVPFAGFEMPVQYSGVIAEHNAVREAVGLFDVSHMGEIVFEGPGAVAAVDHLVTNDIAGLADGQAAYAGLLTPEGGFVDDVVCYRFSAEKVLVCVNASNREKDFQHMLAHTAGEPQPVDEGDRWAQLAVQGPKAPALVQALTQTPLEPIERYHFVEGEVAGFPCIIARTGYTGEDGFELFCAPEVARGLWDRLVEAGALPCGLGARDTLRLEMKYALYGNDIDESHDPYEAGLAWTVKLDKGDFVGREALIAAKAAGPRQKLVAFVLKGRGVPRQGMRVLDESGAEVGVVTSGTMSPTLKEPIGMAYVAKGLARSGSTLQIDLRGRPVAAEVVKPPFVKR